MATKPHEANGATKQRVALSPTGNPVVLKTAPGSVGLLDKLKGYYHTVIVLLSGAVSILAVIADAVKWIPGPVAGYVVAASSIIGVILTALKSNEHWVDSV